VHYWELGRPAFRHSRRAPMRTGLEHECVGSPLQTGLQQRLALFASLATFGLGLSEELRDLVVAVAFGIFNVGFQSQRVAQALLGEPDQVVELVLGPCDLARLLVAAHHRRPFWRVSLW
jgi:hypothetical protein